LTFSLIFYVDYAGNLDGQCSTSGYFFSLGSRLLCWCSKKEQGVGVSSIEVEYAIAIVVHAKKHRSWMWILLGELDLSQLFHSIVFFDN
jgi:hypothetical protein